MQRLDAALGVAAVAAEVPLPRRARTARDRVGSAHDPDDEVAGGEAAAGRRLGDAAQRLVAEHQPLGAGRRLAVVAAHDLGVGAADAERDAVDEQRALLGGRLGHLLQGGRVLHARLQRDRAHQLPPSRSWLIGMVVPSTRAATPRARGAAAPVAAGARARRRRVQPRRGNGAPRTDVLGHGRARHRTFPRTRRRGRARAAPARHVGAAGDRGRRGRPRARDVAARRGRPAAARRSSSTRRPTRRCTSCWRSRAPTSCSSPSSAPRPRARARCAHGRSCRARSPG